MSSADWSDPLPSKYVWKIDHIHKFKNTPVGEWCNSPIFELLGATWQIECCPNAEREQATEHWTSIYWNCVSLGNLKGCESMRTIQIRGCQSHSALNYTYNEEENRGYRSFCPSSMLKDLQEISIECSIYITKPNDLASKRESKSGDHN